MKSTWARTLRSLLLSATLLACDAVLAEPPASERVLRREAQPAALTVPAAVDVDGVRSNVLAATRQVGSARARQPENRADDQMLSSMQGMLEQLRVLQQTLGRMMQDPETTRRAGARIALDQAWLNFEQMASAFQAMTQNLTQVTRDMRREELK